MIQIQSHLILPTYENQYFMKDGNSKSQKISKAKFFALYDKISIDKSIKLLPPITKELT